METDLRETIHLYVQNQAQVKEVSRILAGLRRKQKDLEELINTTAEREHMLDKIVRVGAHTFEWETQTKTSSLTQETLKKALDLYFKTNYGDRLGDARAQIKADEIFQFILNNRTQTPYTKLKYSGNVDET